MNQKNRYRQMFAGLTAMMLLIAGCKSSPATAPAETALPPATSPENEIQTLKITYFNESQFMREYGNAFKKAHPNVKIEVIPSHEINGNIATRLETSVLLEKKPDLVYTPYLITELGNAGKLVDLSILMKQDEMDPAQFSSSALESIRSLTSGGGLYGLSPSFQTMALYYNKAIFDRLQIPYPTNDMSWKQVLELANRIARVEDGKQLYGLEFYSTPLFRVLDYISNTGGSDFSSDYRKALFTSEAYLSATEDIIGAIHNGAVYVQPEKIPTGIPAKESVLIRNKFVAGEAAMRLDTPALISFQKSTAAAVPDFPAFPLSIVPEPLKERSSIIVGDVFGIVAGSPNTKAAWNFIKYLTGPEMAAELEKSKPSVLSIRTDAVKTREGYSLEPFYSRSPNPLTVVNPPISPQTIQDIVSAQHEKITDMIYGRLEVKPGLQSLQDYAQKLLNQEFAEKK